jgi:hypothetical protein
MFTKPSALSPFTFKKAMSFLYYAPAAWLEKQKLNSLENAPA